MDKTQNTQKILEYLSPNEKKIIPYLRERNINEICKKAGLDKVSVLRALEYLKNKKIVELSFEKRKSVGLGVNGSLYKKIGLPERRLLNILDSKRILLLREAQKLSKLSDNEFKAAIGALKKKAMIEVRKEKVILSAGREELAKKMLEESFLESLPLDYNSISAEQMYSINSLRGRKNIIEIKEERKAKFEITLLGKKLIETRMQEKNGNLIENLDVEIIRKGSWKGRRFRRYDVLSNVPEISGGKKHFVNQAIEYGKKIWLEMGFKEMTGNMLASSFWNFDALFTAQDHPVREMHDTFFIQHSYNKTELPEKKIIKAVKQAHESGVDGSRGWQYSWDEEQAKKLILRTHTTCLSAQTLNKLKQNNLKELPAKFFAFGKCFRNETIDWSHGFEFNQTEGIVIDENVNFKHLLGYLKQFFTKMGFGKIRFTPAYFPYTEPSVEISVWHPEKKVWLELGGAGIFRPEVTEPLLGKSIPVLAWGPGFDRILMDYYQIKDLRELYKNDLNQLRKMKFWMK